MDELGVELEVHNEPAHYVAFNLNATGAAVLGFAAVVLGWSMKNASGTTLAALDIYDGTDHTGTSLFPIQLAANQTGRDWFGPNGILFRNGLYINVTAQQVSGAVFYRRAHHKWV